jgi:phosphoglycerol transferase MdoB-like AlkP superfamily enzyme
VHYTDKQLGDFFNQAKKKEWYKNTLFIVLADHSHMTHKNYYPESFNYRHIPMLMLGGALKDSLHGKTNDRLCGNADITSTLLKQLNLPDHNFYWSKNIFNPYSPQFAFFELNYGFGWMRPYGRLETDIRGPVDYFTDIPKDSLPNARKEGQAYVQVLLQEFISY